MQKGYAEIKQPGGFEEVKEQVEKLTPLPG